MTVAQLRPSTIPQAAVHELRRTHHRASGTGEQGAIHACTLGVVSRRRRFAARVGSRVGRPWVCQAEIASTPASVVEVAVDSLAMALRLLRTAGLRTERGLSRADKERPLE